VQWSFTIPLLQTVQWCTSRRSLICDTTSRLCKWPHKLCQSFTHTNSFVKCFHKICSLDLSTGWFKLHCPKFAQKGHTESQINCSRPIKTKHKFNTVQTTIDDRTIQGSAPQVFDVSPHLLVTTHQWHGKSDDEHIMQLYVNTSNNNDIITSLPTTYGLKQHSTDDRRGQIIRPAATKIRRQTCF